MTSIYLWVNAVIYFAFAAWCTLAPTRTAAGVGYASLTPSGLSEYLVVYGGLQLGLGLFFAWCARRGLDRTGLIFALAVYAPIVAYRAASVAKQWPVASTTLMVAALELSLLVAALALWFLTVSTDR